MLAPLLLTLLPLLPSTANAHTETGAVGGLISGFLHPLTGLDHVVAMVAVSRGEVLLAVMFPFVMSLGSALRGGRSLPKSRKRDRALRRNPGLDSNPPLRIAGAIVGLFAIFHGHTLGLVAPCRAVNSSCDREGL